MTNQEMFDQVYLHFMQGGKFSFEFRATEHPNGVKIEHVYPTCLYRGPDGARCAGGLFIDDDHYKLEFEGRGVRDYDIKEVLFATGLTDEQTLLLAKLQQAHDYGVRVNSHNPRPDFDLYMRDVARDTGLTVPELPKDKTND